MRCFSIGGDTVVDILIFRPLNKNPSKKASEVYLELPSDCRHLYMNQRSPTPIRYDYKSVLEPKLKSGHFYSTGKKVCCLFFF